MREADAERPPARLEDGGEVPYLDDRLALPRAGRARPHPARTSRGETASCGSAWAARPTFATRWSAGTGARPAGEIEPRLDAAAARAGTPYTKLSIRSQRTRWASCSSSGAMSFNWRLLLGPEAILDYVVEHEVAHLKVHDHSARFWRLLESRCPEYETHERWLRQNGPTLRLP